MNYRSHIGNGVVVLDVPVALPDGAQESIHIQAEPRPADNVVRVRVLFGSISSGDARSADNASIGQHLARA